MKLKSKPYKYLLHLALWVFFIFGITYFSRFMNRISHYLPVHYYTSLLLLIPIYYLSNYFIDKKKLTRYLSIILLLFVVYFYFPIFFCKILPKNELTLDLFSTKHYVRSKVRMGTSILFFSVWAISIIRYIAILRENTKKLKEANTKAELMMLKSQINPHFFFNSLNAIYYLSMQKSDEAPVAIIKLSDMMRYVLTDANSEKVLLVREQEYLNKYVDIQRLRLPEKTTLDFQINIEDGNKKIAPLLFIPFVENCFKFGTSANHNTKIYIKLEATCTKISLYTKNQITSKKEKSTSTGLENVKKRLDLLYPNKHKLQIKNEERYFTVNLEITF